MVYDIYIYQVNGNGIIREYSMDGCGIYIYPSGTSSSVARVAGKSPNYSWI